jgi:hypothetical protein
MSIFFYGSNERGFMMVRRANHSLSWEQIDVMTANNTLIKQHFRQEIFFPPYSLYTYRIRCPSPSMPFLS